MRMSYQKLAQKIRKRMYIVNEQCGGVTHLPARYYRVKKHEIIRSFDYLSHSNYVRMLLSGIPVASCRLKIKKSFMQMSSQKWPRK